MKKILSFVMLIIFTVFAVACDPATLYFDVEDYGEQVEKIELRYSELNGTPKTINISDGVVPEFHLNETTLVETLDVDKIMDFCNEFSIIEFHQIYECVKKPFGYILIMYLSTGNYLVASRTEKGQNSYAIFAEFSAGEEFVQCFGRFADGSAFCALLAKYYDSYTYVIE